MGYASDEPFKGVFIDELASDEKTSVMAAPGATSLFGYDKDGKYVAGGFGRVKSLSVRKPNGRTASQ